MKRIFALLFIFLCMGATAQTINWYVDGSVYDTTTCQSGDNVTPPTPPAKYGHTFKWWVDPSLITGTVTQNGTPTPDNPIYPTFYQNGDLILRAIDSGTNSVADTYSSATGQIVRRIGVKVFDGTEDWDKNATANYYRIAHSSIGAIANVPMLCSHFIHGPVNIVGNFNNSEKFINFHPNTSMATTTEGWKTWLTAQYNAGTPVTIYYPLKTPVIENYTPSNP